MITTRFLPIRDFYRYGDWLREQSAETLAQYFGIAVGPEFITNLIDRILSDPKKHYFLVATRGKRWVGLIHMACISESDMEFGVMVAEDQRHQGIADQLMSQAINWIQNRGFNTLYLHCLNRNTAMKHLATKHGLKLHKNYGDVESKTQVPPASLWTHTQEMFILNQNIFYSNLQNIWTPFTQILC